MSKYKAPKYLETAFNCPQCNAYAKQLWSDIYLNLEEDEDYVKINLYDAAVCTHCDALSIWEKKKLIFPPTDETDLPAPNEDLNESIREDYIEASKILHISPRGSTAILRLCLQKLCIQLGEKGKNINDDIASLVKKGLNVKVQQALDVVRVIGNNAVHPGEINIKDDNQTAISLLNLINIIADVMITQILWFENP